MPKGVSHTQGLKPPSALDELRDPRLKPWATWKPVTSLSYLMSMLAAAPLVMASPLAMMRCTSEAATLA